MSAPGGNNQIGEASAPPFQSLIEHVTDMIVVLGADGTIGYASPAAERMTGHRVADFIGTSALDLVHPDDHSAVLAALEGTVRDGGGRTPTEFRLRKADGTFIPVETVANNRLNDPEVRGIIVTVRDISARLAAEQTLRAAEERFRVAFDEAPNGMAMVSPDGRWLRVNAEMCRLIGYNQDELLGLTVVDITDPADLENDIRLGAECLAGQRRSYSLEQPYRHKDGHMVIAHTWVALIRDDDGTPLYFLSQTQDVTSQRRDEEALRQAEARFRMAFDHAPIGMALVSPYGAMLSVNDALCIILDRPEGELLSVTLDELTHTAHRDETAAALRRLAAGAVRTYRSESRFLAAGDRVVWGHLSIAPIGDRDPAEAFIVQMEDITDRKNAEDALLHQTLHDTLTGLPNRLLLRDRLGHALTRLERAPESIAVLFIDLDRFKIVNDSLGHDAGDQVLIEVGRRLSRIARRADTVARIGGDEFVVLAEGLTGEGEAVAIAERVREVVAEPLTVAGSQLVPSASVGIAMALDINDTPEQLLRAADTAMYQAKERGRDRHEVYDTSLQRRAQRRMEIEGRLRQALDEGGLRNVYQPIVDIHTGEVTNVEALVRMQHPGGSLMVPADFMEVAEDTGLIVAIGEWVLGEALAQHVRWQATLGADTPRVTVNLAARQIGSRTFVDDLRKALAVSGVQAASLSLELTESVLLEASQTTMESLAELRAAGVSLGIDDFGTGYSSLTYLRRFPVDFVKVDRSFVAGLGRDEEDDAIVRAVVSLGRALGLRTIAEGVESAHQLDILEKLGCDQAQGYYIAMPMPGDNLQAMLADGWSDQGRGASNS